MSDIFAQAQHAAQRGEALSRERDIQTYRALFTKDHWNEAEFDTIGEITQRAQTDPALWTAMEQIHATAYEEVTPEDVARAQKIVNRVFREYYEER